MGVSSLDLFTTKLASPGATSGPSSGSTSGEQLDASLDAAGRPLARNASEPLVEGDLIELECVAHGARPAANITWFNGHDQLAGSGPGSEQLVGGALQRTRSLRPKRLLQRQQVQLNADGRTFTTHSFLSMRLSRHEHRAQISCQASNELAPVGKARAPLTRTLELNVQRKYGATSGLDTFSFTSGRKLGHPTSGSTSGL